MSSGPTHELPIDLPTMTQAAEYRICVRGTLSPGEVELLAGLAVEWVHGEARAAVTCLRGRLADQAALVGVINALYARQCPVVSVRVVESETDTHAAGAPT